MPIAIKATCEQYVDINGAHHFLSDTEQLKSGQITGDTLYDGDFKGSEVTTSFGLFGLFRKLELYGRFKGSFAFSYRPNEPVEIERGKCYVKVEDAIEDAKQQLTGEEPEVPLEASKQIKGQRFYVAMTSMERDDCIDIWNLIISQSR